jgi:hypothetical protein
MLQSPNKCVAITTEPPFKKMVEVTVVAAKVDVCANTNKYVSEFCLGLSQLNPSNKFVCTVQSIDFEPCENGVCSCGGTRRRLLSDGCVLSVSVKSVATTFVLPTKSNLPWVQSAQVAADTTTVVATAGNGGVVAGGAVACVVVAAAGAAFWFRRRKAPLAIQKKTDALPQSRADLVFVDKRLHFEPWF